MALFLRMLRVKAWMHVLIPVLLILFAMPAAFGFVQLFQIQNYSLEHSTPGFYYVVDTFDMKGKTTMEAVKDENSLSQLKQLYALEQEAWGSSYLISTTQHVYQTEPRFPLQFVAGSDYIPEQDLDPLALSSVQMNAAAIQNSPMELASGRFFQEEDYTYQKGKPVPVLLGYEYQKEVALNDTFEIEYLWQPLTVQVVGFLQPGAASFQAPMNPLDSSIVLPAMAFPDPVGVHDRESQTIIYMNHTSGFVDTPQTALQVQQMLDDFCKQVGIQPYVLIGVFSWQVFGLGIAQTNWLALLGAPLVILAIAVVLLSWLRWRKTRAVLHTLSNDEIPPRAAWIPALWLDTLLWTCVAAAVSISLSLTVLQMFQINLLVLCAILAGLWLVMPLLSIVRIWSSSRPPALPQPREETQESTEHKQLTSLSS